MKKIIYLLNDDFNFKDKELLCILSTISNKELLKKQLDCICIKVNVNNLIAVLNEKEKNSKYLSFYNNFITFENAFSKEKTQLFFYEYYLVMQSNQSQTILENYLYRITNNLVQIDYKLIENYL